MVELDVVAPRGAVAGRAVSKPDLTLQQGEHVVPAVDLPIETLERDHRL